MQSDCSCRWFPGCTCLWLVYSSFLFSAEASVLTGDLLDLSAPSIFSKSLQGILPEPEGTSLPSGQWLLPLPPECKKQECNLAIALEPDWQLDCQPEKNCQMGPAVDGDQHLKNIKPYSRITVHSTLSGQSMHLLTVTTAPNTSWDFETPALMPRLQTPGDDHFSPVLIARADPVFICDPDDKWLDIGWLRRDRERLEAMLQQLQENKPTHTQLIDIDDDRSVNMDYRLNFVGSDCLSEAINGTRTLSPQARTYLQNPGRMHGMESIAPTRFPHQFFGDITAWRWRITSDGTMVIEIKQNGVWQQAPIETARVFQGYLFELLTDRLEWLLGYNSASGPYGYNGHHNSKLRVLFDHFRREDARKIVPSHTLGNGSTSTVSPSTSSASLSMPESITASSSIELQPSVTPTNDPQPPANTVITDPVTPPAAHPEHTDKDSEEAKLLKLKSQLGMSEGQFNQWLSLLSSSKVGSQNSAWTLSQLSQQGRLKPSWYLPSLILLVPMEKALSVVDTNGELVKAGPRALTNPAPSELENQIQQLGWSFLQSRSVLDREALLSIHARLKDGPQSIIKSSSITSLRAPSPSNDAHYQAGLLAAISDTLLLNLQNPEAIQMLTCDVTYVLNQRRPPNDQLPAQLIVSPEPEDPDPGDGETIEKISLWEPGGRDWAESLSPLTKLRKQIRENSRRLFSSKTIETSDEMRLLLNKMGYSSDAVTTATLVNGYLEIEVRDNGQESVVRLETFDSQKLPDFRKMMAAYDKVQTLDDSAKQALLQVNAHYLHDFPEQGFGVYLQVTPPSGNIAPDTYSRVELWQKFLTLSQQVIALGQSGITFVSLNRTNIREQDGRWVIVVNQSGFKQSPASSGSYLPLKDLVGIMVEWHGKASPIQLFQKVYQISENDPDVQSKSLIQKMQARFALWTVVRERMVELLKNFEEKNTPLMYSLAVSNGYTASKEVKTGEFALMDKLVLWSESNPLDVDSFLSITTVSLQQLFPAAGFGGGDSEPEPEPEPELQTAQVPDPVPSSNIDNYPRGWTAKKGDPLLNPADLSREELSDLMKRVTVENKQELLTSLNQRCYQYSGQEQHIRIDEDGKTMKLVVTRSHSAGAKYLVRGMRCSAENPRPYFLVIGFLASIDASIDVHLYPLRIPAYKANGDFISAFKDYLQAYFPLEERIGRLNRKYVLRIAPSHIQRRNLPVKEHWCLQMYYDEKTGITAGLGVITLDYNRRYCGSRTADRQYFARFSRRFLAGDQLPAQTLEDPIYGLYVSADAVKGASRRTEDYTFFEKLLESRHPPKGTVQKMDEYEQSYEKARKHINKLKEDQPLRTVQKEPKQCLNCEKPTNPLQLLANKGWPGFCTECILTGGKPWPPSRTTHETSKKHLTDDNIGFWSENSTIRHLAFTRQDFQRASGRISAFEESKLRLLATDVIKKGWLGRVSLADILKTLVTTHRLTLNYIFSYWLNNPDAYNEVVKDIRQNHFTDRR